MSYGQTRKLKSKEEKGEAAGRSLGRRGRDVEPGGSINRDRLSRQACDPSARERRDVE
jgi:hypothetical protein